MKHLGSTYEPMTDEEYTAIIEEMQTKIDELKRINDKKDEIIQRRTDQNGLLLDRIDEMYAVIDKLIENAEFYGDEASYFDCDIASDGTRWSESTMVKDSGEFSRSVLADDLVKKYMEKK